MAMEYPFSTDILADLPLPLLVKHLRTNSFRGPLTQRLVAKIIGRPIEYVSQLENGKAGLDTKDVEDLSVFFGQNKLDQRMIYRALLKATIIHRFPEAQDLIDAQGEVLPPQVIKRIKKDLEGFDTARKARLLEVSEEAFQDILDGLRPISRKQLFTLAKALGQNPVEYLLLSARMPYETLDVLINSPNLFDTLVRASHESSIAKEEDTLEDPSTRIFGP